MSVLHLAFCLPSPHVALARPTLAFFNATMFSRAVSTHQSCSQPKVQRPLNLNSSATNIQQSAPAQAVKRKFDRTMSSTSSLGQLHQNHYFNENDFDDDVAIDLTADSPIKHDINYAKIGQADKVAYPSLPPPPPRASQSGNVPSSSAPVPWSSSPVEHHRKPEPRPISDFMNKEEPLKKRRKLPWEQAKDAELQQQTHLQRPQITFTPLPKDKDDGEKYPWNKTASAVKEEQKKHREKNKQSIFKPKFTEPGTTGPPKMPSSHLSEEQRGVAKAVVEEGKSVFFTGSAGTGKSVLMRAIISQLRSKFRREPDRLAITASTGLAACVIEGTTLHSWAGIGLGKEPVPELVKKIRRNAKTRAKWLRTKVLIVDEISMVDGELFDKLEQIARALRNNGRPFGGIQLVVTGDFFQLPPVPDKNQVAKFAFDAATWNTCIEHTILLTHVFRQKDPTFANMLNEMRLGKLSAASINEFKKLARPLSFHDNVDATELFPTRGEVDGANNSRMTKLSGQVMTFAAMDSGVSDLNVRSKILQNFLAPESLTLKKGAQVMLIKNIDPQLVNGTLGKVTSFMDEATYSTYKTDEETYQAGYRDGDEDAKNKFDAKRFQNKEPGSVSRYWPMVRFPLPDGTYRDMLCQPEEWKTENQQGEITAKRVQVPLILAWALSIHKAQGQTLSRVKVDLGKVFERGQAYVALSRATSQEGLQVLRFDPRKVMVHPKVITFYHKLTSYDNLGSKAPKQSTIVPTKKEVEVDEDEELYMYG